MNTCTQISPSESSLVPPRATRWPFTTLQRFFYATRFTSVDLTDTIFASLPDRSETQTETSVPPLPLAERPERSRLMPWRFI